jgi:hypothetical protein
MLKSMESGQTQLMVAGGLVLNYSTKTDGLLNKGLLNKFAGNSSD